MVIVKLKGGLGNQMFQYAAGRRLAHARNTILKLDLSFFSGQTLRPYLLGHFNIQEEFATADEVARLTLASRHRLARLASRLLQSIRPYYRRRMILETHFHFDPNVLMAPAHVYLDGYWQSEKYFAHIEGIIRAEFTLKHRLNAKALEVANQIKETASVGLHFRRGDYLSDPKTQAYHGTCGSYYYQSGIRLLLERCPRPHFFVFSDDPEWNMTDLPVEYPRTLVSWHAATADYEELYLMSLCRHFIIANSSFSWWAAWLSASPDKLVFAPRRWFVHDSHDTRDLFPAGWRAV